MLRRIINIRSFGTSAKEIAMEERLKQILKANPCIVEDVSGGCGSFFKVKINSPQFIGKSRVEKSRLVHSALKEEIGEMHGMNIEFITETTS